jgi:2-amino-4-hydroxy-6-hydroxymethyldihydropteridine diphosphokinase
VAEAVILLGSNIDPAINIRRGAKILSERLPVIKSSLVWSTPSIGTNGPDFYNAAIMCLTDTNADDLKFAILRPIEEELGRVRTSDKYASRTLDLDVVILNGIVLDPRLWDTAFIFLPVSELEPDLIKPGSEINLAQMAIKKAPESGARIIENFPLFE